jgi:hypothetical protein
METNEDSGVGESPPNPSSGAGIDGVVKFDGAPGLKCDVRSASGNLRIRLAEGSACEVRMSTNDADPRRRFALVECVYDASTNQLLVDTKAGQVTGTTGMGIKKAWSRWIDTVRHDVDLELLVPASASVKFRTASGDLRADAELDTLDVASASGDASAAGIRGSLKFRSASGDLEASDVGGPVESKTASGDLRVERVSGDVNIQTVSGDVSVNIDGPVAARFNTVSGDVRVGVSPGLLIDFDANTVSGDLVSEIALDGGHDDSKEKSLQLKVRTVSGDVRIHRN